MSFVTIQDWMLELELSARGTLLYAIIYGFSQDGHSKCYATQDYFCKWLRCTRPTLHKAITELVERGLIIKEQPNAHGKCTYYAVPLSKETLRPQCKEALFQCKENLFQCKKDLFRPSKKALHNNKYNNNNNKINIYGDFERPKENKPNYETEFSEIWDVYPRKEGKLEALSAYVDARNEGVSADTIKQGVQRYSKQINDAGIEPQYIMQGGNWFRERRWEDQYIETKTRAGARQTKRNPALKHMWDGPYTKEYLQSLGVSFGEEFYDDI